MSARLTVLVLLAALALLAEDSIHFEREFPGSVPGQFQVEVKRDGSALYSEGGETPVELQLGEATVEEIFKNAEALDFFARPLASQRKVASTGRKVLRYRSGGTIRGEATFDYSEIPEARELASWFVKLAGTQQHLLELERAYRFDRLGVNEALVHLEMAYDRNRIVAPQLLEPILSQIVKQSRIVHLARARAEGMLERIRTRER